MFGVLFVRLQVQRRKKEVRFQGQLLKTRVMLVYFRVQRYYVMINLIGMAAVLCSCCLESSFPTPHRDRPQGEP